MSGISYESTCPNCGNPCHAYTDSKPFEYTDLTCHSCGFYTTTIIGYMNLEELNEARKNASWGELTELTELPEQGDL